MIIYICNTNFFAHLNPLTILQKSSFKKRYRQKPFADSIKSLNANSFSFMLIDFCCKYLLATFSKVLKSASTLYKPKLYIKIFVLVALNINEANSTQNGSQKRKNSTVIKSSKLSCKLVYLINWLQLITIITTKI